MSTVPCLWLALAACVGGPPGAQSPDKTLDSGAAPATAETGATTPPPTETGTTPTPTGPDLFQDVAQADFLQGQPDGAVVGVDGVSLDPGTAAGTFRSRVFDAGRPVRIEQIEWLPDAPYGKPLPDGSAAEVGYPSGGIDMQDTALLLHFEDLVAPVVDGAVVADSSGNGNDAFAVREGGARRPGQRTPAFSSGGPTPGFSSGGPTPGLSSGGPTPGLSSGGPTPGVTSRENRGSLSGPAVAGGVSAGPHGLAYEDDVDTWLRVPVTANHELQLGVVDFTWSYWVNTTQSCPYDAPPSGNRVHLGAEETASDTTHVWLGCLNSAATACGGVADGTARVGGTLRPMTGESLSFCGSTPLNDGRWHHVALVKAGHAATTLSVYVDGALDGEVQGALTAPITFETEVDWGIGAFSRGTYQAAATFDEVAIVRRAWTASDALDAFRRGRTALTLAVRACNEADCSDDPRFSPAVADPAQGLTAPVSAEVTSLFGQYLQYEATFASEALPVVPLLREVTLHVAD
jgi:hypothetical protein